MAESFRRAGPVRSASLGMSAARPTLSCGYQRTGLCNPPRFRRHDLDAIAWLPCRRRVERRGQRGNRWDMHRGRVRSQPAVLDWAAEAGA